MSAILEAATVLLASGFVVLICGLVLLEQRRKRGAIGAGNWIAAALFAGPAAVVFLATLLGFK